MKVFVNQSTNKIDNSGLNVVPIELKTDIKLEQVISQSSDQKINDEGELLYKDSNGNETNQSWEIDTVTSSFEPFDFAMDKINLIDGSLNKIDEDIKYANINDNTPLLDTVNFVKTIERTEENVEDYSIDYLMEIELNNLLEQSNYDYVLYDILNDIIYSNSSFYSRNKYISLLDTDDKLYIKLNQIETTSNISLAIYGVDKNANVYINDNLCIYDEESDSFRINIQNTLTENLKLEIVNRTENIIQVNNPYILFSY